MFASISCSISCSRTLQKGEGSLTKRSHIALLLAATVVCRLPAGPTNARSKQVLDKAIKALGGEEKLDKAEALTWKSEGQDHDRGESKTTSPRKQQLRSRSLPVALRGRIDGNQVEGVAILVRRRQGLAEFNDQSMEMDADAVKNEKRTVYLMVVSATIVPLKSKGFRLSPPPTSPSRQTCRGARGHWSRRRIHASTSTKGSRLLVHMKAKVIGFNGERVSARIDVQRLQGLRRYQEGHESHDQRVQGETSWRGRSTDSRSLDKVPADTFAEPK